MYIQRIYKKTPTKTYTSVVLMESYREGGKVKHRIISNLSKWPDNLIAALENILKGEKTLPVSAYNSEGKIIQVIPQTLQRHQTEIIKKLKPKVVVKKIKP